MANKQLVAASTKPLVLSILSHGRNYGYRIIKEIERLSDGELQWTDAMLYPVMKRMQNDGLITAQWVETENGRKRKYYEITEAGKEWLQQERSAWLKVNRALARLWAGGQDLELTVG
ncbi:PadR family transcriptional regulator [Lewinella sp. 4G2]|uniref:PadR family transcriptional regulator n=1 Tax=Lewinella sp. 4G2 TaxID=1803372 RepID=UPI0007B49589|nr:helix-turn-helix transcriptional regulator [Lewinella sp. 4G2]OAV42586.1 PadR family transcriptional regulator [Lewinella sp. 4G2]